jgi:hypothetical protein
MEAVRRRRDPSPTRCCDGPPHPNGEPYPADAAAPLVLLRGIALPTRAKLKANLD